MFCVRIFAVAGCVLLFAAGTVNSQYKNTRGFIEQEDKLDYKDMIIKKLLMKLNDVLRDRRQGEMLQPPRPATVLPPKIIPQLPPPQIHLQPPCLQQLPRPPQIHQIRQLPPPQIHQIHQIHRPALKQQFRPADQPPNFQPQFEFEEVPCPCEECPCCQEIQYEEVPCPCCEQQIREDPFVTRQPAGNVMPTGPIFAETFECQQGCKPCAQRCSQCNQQPQVKALPQPQQQPPQQVLMVTGRPQVQTVLPQTLHPSFFTGFTQDDPTEERMVQKSQFIHPKLNELLHAAHSDTC